MIWEVCQWLSLEEIVVRHCGKSFYVCFYVILSTALKDSSARGNQLATRLSSRTKLQVLFCGNLQEGQDIMWKCLEARLSEEIACNPDFFAI